ncbi:unnamed protein product [Prorocentrum cordatum]|uniref:Uncharacterized protein n=1 Tax=Prorocentrum cordatum TaxID=2364126 RepID=A0ABN9S0P2_9DINO|nr:unnamed protein product [Polarella glacialis]
MPWSTTTSGRKVAEYVLVSQGHSQLDAASKWTRTPCLPISQSCARVLAVLEAVQQGEPAGQQRDLAQLHRGEPPVRQRAAQREVRQATAECHGPQRAHAPAELPRPPLPGHERPGTGGTHPRGFGLSQWTLNLKPRPPTS